MGEAVEGMRLSNHIYDRFKGVPNDEQIIFKEEQDGNFLLAVKVVDNILSVATRRPLQQQLVAAIETNLRTKPRTSLWDCNSNGMKRVTY